MRLIRSFEYRADTDSTGELVDRVLAAVSPAVPVWTYLEDRIGARTSAIQRALKKFPTLAALGRSGATASGERQVIASLPQRDTPERFAVPIEREVASELAHGVPKALPFMYSNFLLGPVPELWLADGEPAAPAEIGARPFWQTSLASIAITSSWWTTRRQLGVEAHVCMTAPPRDAAKLPPLPPDTKRLLGALGGRPKEKQYLLPDDSEAEMQTNAEPAARVVVENTSLRDIALPNPDLADDRQHADAFGSFKDTLGELLPSFRHRSSGARGVWVMTKRTAAQNELVLRVDRGPLGGEARAWLEIRGALWSHTFNLPASRKAESLRVWNPGTLRELCRNWVAAIELLERGPIPELEALYWPGFAWYSAG